MPKMTHNSNIFIHCNVNYTHTNHSMADDQNFLAPRLIGKRFDDHSIPLEIFEDFSAFEDLLIELAKHIYFQENSQRQRVPRGFSNDVTLKIAGVGEGSAIPKIMLAALMSTGAISPYLPYFEKAKENIILAVDAAEHDKNVTEFIPTQLLGYFNIIGRGLRADESIILRPGSEKNGVLNKETRKKLVLASSSVNEIFYEMTAIASIPEVDKDKNTFTIISNGQRVVSKLPRSHKKEIIEAFGDFESRRKVKIQGVGKFNRADRLLSIEKVKHVVLLDALDINSRLEELSQLPDGWNNGEGKEINKKDLEWFADFFDTSYDTTLPLPYLYPTLDGGIQAEWVVQNEFDISITFDLENKVAYYHSLNIKADEVDDFSLNMTDLSFWDKINSKLKANLKK